MTAPAPLPDPISELLAQVCALPALPAPRLTPNERRRLGGRILPIGSALVTQVARALLGAPELFPELPGAAAELAAEQSQALRCLGLRHALLGLAEQAQDRYLTLQARAVERSLAILKDAAEGRAPSDLAEAEARHLQLLPAIVLKVRYEDRVQQRRAARRGARKEALRLAAGVPEGSDQAPAPREAARRQRLLAARQDRAAARARLHEQFESHFQRTRRPGPMGPQGAQGAAAAPISAAPVRPPVAAGPAPAATSCVQTFPLEIPPSPSIFLENEAGPGAAGAGGPSAKERRMNERDQKLIEEFISQKELQRQAPSLSAVYQKSTAELAEGLARARALLAGRPRTELSDEQRAVLTERLPLFGAVAAAFVEAMRGDEAASGTGAGGDAQGEVRAEDLAEVAHLERALSRVVWATQLLREGADNGALIAGATAATLCQGALRHYQAQAADSSLPEAARRGVQALCEEALRIDAESRRKQAEESAANDRNAAPYLAAISEAQRRAESARLIESYLADTKNRSRP